MKKLTFTAKPRCFVSTPPTPEFRPVYQAIGRAIQKAGYEASSLQDEILRPAGIDEALIGELGRADFVVADVTGRNPNVFFELGLAQAMGKGTFLLASSESQGDIPSDFRGHQFFSYSPTRTGLGELTKRLAKTLREYRAAPLVARSFLAPRIPGYVSIDWDRLDRSDAENLCRELLAQLGYQHVDWDTRSRGFDLVAELPKRDPDGYEYRELWLITMGRRIPNQVIFDMLANDPEYLVFRLLEGDTRWEQIIASGSTITLLIISFEEPASVDKLDAVLRFKHVRGRVRGRDAANFRTRIWDRAYLTTLVQQFPQLAYKYFSDEDRSRLKYRKSPEQLYHENVRLLNKQSALLSQLDDEKNKRIRAERDAIWKDVSFSAAHKIGNPIFAIETYLDPLNRRVRESRTEEATEIIGSIRLTVEKAKGIVDQFKSLSRAQEISPVPVLLKPILDDACSTACNQQLRCTVVCSESLMVFADPERVAECFDELVSNASLWCNNSDPQIEIEAVQANPGTLPASLESDKQYVLIHVRDNGVGTSIENKERIFDAFFTTREHGTGLGLALVRRILEGHGGTIREVGVPGQGADFEVYIPAHSATNSPSPALKP